MVVVEVGRWGGGSWLVGRSVNTSVSVFGWLLEKLADWTMSESSALAVARPRTHTQLPRTLQPNMTSPPPASPAHATNLLTDEVEDGFVVKPRHQFQHQNFFTHVSVNFEAPSRHPQGKVLPSRDVHAHLEI